MDRAVGKAASGVSAIAEGRGMDYEDDFHRFLQEVKAAYTAARDLRPELSPDLDILIAALSDLPTERIQIPAQTEPVCRHLKEALALGEMGPAAPLSLALRPLVERLCWYHVYDLDGSLPAFSQNYAHAEIMGPPSTVPSHAIRCGLILMAPRTFYPAHFHTAPELYYVLGGTARWRRGEETWALQPPGSFILHPSRITHAMETDEEPLLALYAWHGSLEPDVAFAEGAL
jgi:quercetin dioxygenase-like cupin family protein